MEDTANGNRAEAQPEPENGIKGFFSKHGPDIGLAVFILYVILLAVGTIAEVFQIQPVLDWWIFRSPGR